jgi:hypothetical protein
MQWDAGQPQQHWGGEEREPLQRPGSQAVKLLTQDPGQGRLIDSHRHTIWPHTHNENEIWNRDRALAKTPVWISRTDFDSQDKALGKRPLNYSSRSLWFHSVRTGTCVSLHVETTLFSAFKR